MSDGAFLGRPLCTLVIPNTLLLRLYEEKRGFLEGVNSSITGGVLDIITRYPQKRRLASARIIGTRAYV